MLFVILLEADFKRSVRTKDPCAFSVGLTESIHLSVGRTCEGMLISWTEYLMTLLPSILGAKTEKSGLF